MHDSLPTPAIVIDGSVVRRNLRRMADFASEAGLKVRPHTKTHKSKVLARMQMEHGAAGLTVAKPGEAEVMAEVTDDLLLAYPAVDAARSAVVASLARGRTVRAAVDSAVAADALAEAARSAGSTVGVLVDLDVGMHRTGVQGPEPALALAQHISRLAGLRLDGILFYPGHVWDQPAEQERALAAIDSLLGEVLSLWEKHGLRASIVSGGSTPTAFQSRNLRHVTEIRPGTYVYNDMNCVANGFATLGDCAARIIATVVSDAVPGQVVLDAGTKTLTSDRLHGAPDAGHGYIVEYPECKITKLSEEHGQVDVTRSARAPRIGERVTVIPNHICPCVNLQDRVYWADEPGATPRPLPVDARGKVF